MGISKGSLKLEKIGHVLATRNPNILGAGRLELFCLTEVCDQALNIEMTTLASSNSHVLRTTDFKSLAIGIT